MLEGVIQGVFISNENIFGDPKKGLKVVFRGKKWLKVRYVS